ncbi:MAG TPA: type II toxin-antitoxin system PemK/MazF family toxin [Candidatus Paceibacterota bacterium]
MKSFDEWNEHKKTTDMATERRFHKPREIWWCRLGINIGHEQDGSGPDSRRPVLVIRSFSREVCLVVPLSTSQKSNKYYMGIGLHSGKRSFAILSQIRLIDSKRLLTKISLVGKEEFAAIRKNIRDLI